jgi:hypothetical protein
MDWMLTLELPPSDTPDPLPQLPLRVDRQQGARIVTHFFFPLASRSLERWPLNWIYINSRATCETAALFDEARRRLTAARDTQPVAEEIATT